MNHQSRNAAWNQPLSIFAALVTIANNGGGITDGREIELRESISAGKKGSNWQNKASM